MRGTDRGLGFENLDGEFGYLVKKHCFDVPRGKNLGFVEGFVVSISEEEGHEPDGGKVGDGCELL